MRKISIHPDDAGSIDLTPAGERREFAGAIRKPSQGPGNKSRMGTMNRKDLLIVILIILSAVVAAFIVLT
jgi:hypothetical protein